MCRARVAAVVLAAGRATRFGASAETSKVLALLGHKPLVRWVVEAALASRAVEVVAVTGQAAPRVAGALSPLAVRVVDNPAFATGMASSLRAGLDAVGPDIDGALVLLADMPLVTAAILDRLIARFEAEGMGVDAVIPTNHGRKGNPVLLGRSMFPVISGLTGDQGAGRILAEPGWRAVAHPIDDDAIECDVDTESALAALRRP